MITYSIWKNYTDVGALASREGKLDVAQRMFSAALEEAKKLHKKELSASYSNLAEIHLQLNDIEAAEQFYKRALEICEKTPDELSLVRIYDGLAEASFRKSRYDKARPLLKKLIALQGKLFGLEHPLLVQQLLKLAFIFCKHGRFDDALDLRQRAERIRRLEIENCYSSSP